MAVVRGPQNAALWRTVTRLDKSKINSQWVAVRNSLAVAAPLAIGMAMGNPLGAVAVTTGALNVSYSDGRDPYAQRARRMLTWTVLGAIAVFIGSLAGATNWAAVLLTFVWAFIAGLMPSISTRAGDLGLNTLVSLIVFAGRGQTSPEGAFLTALLVLLGGLLQTGFALLFWPLQRYQPERRAVGGVYLALAKEIGPHSDPLASTPLQAPSPEVQDTLAALGRDHSLEGERFRLLFDQADRIRLSAFVLTRLHDQLHELQSDAALEAAHAIDRLLEVASELMRSVGECLTSGHSAKCEDPSLAQAEQTAQQVRAVEQHPEIPIASDVVSAVDVLIGQLRAVTELTSRTVPSGLDESARRELGQPLKYQIRSWVATLRANLDLRSSFCRHAIRLAIWVSLGDAIGRVITGRRAYWIPMTIAVVLRPDFSTTFSRGVLRLLGTLVGLGLATALYHLLPESPWSQLLLVGVFTFVLRYIGPANYGVFSIAITGLIVFLIAASGIPESTPREVVLERGINTGIGGVLALIAYAAWPTWERTQVSEAIAQMLDACRAYFHAVVERFGRADASLESELDETRGAWRRARSATDASVDRVAAEPGITAERLQLLTSILASSHGLVHAIMAVEAGIIQRQPQTPPDVFEKFAHDVEFTLYYLAAALRGSAAATETLPRLREDYRRMLEARDQFSAADEFILKETDHITTALNTLREQVMRLVGQAESNP